MPAGIHVPGGWCSRIKIQIHTSAGGPWCICFGLFKTVPSKGGSLKTSNDGLLSKAWNHDTGELPPPKTLEIKSAGINIGGLSPSGSPLLHCYDSHWPGAPFLLVPSDRHDEHYSNKPRSMRHFSNFFKGYHRCGPTQGCIQYPPSPPGKQHQPAPPRVSAGRAFPPKLPTIPTPTATSATFPGLPDYQKQGFK